MTDEHLDRLLAGNPGHSITEKEQILVRVLDTCLPRADRPGFSVRLKAFLIPMVATATVLVVAPFLVFHLRSRQAVDSEFASRGASGKERSTLLLACTRPTSPPLAGRGVYCRIGDKLLFKIDSPRRFRYLSAFASGPAEKVVWYFPGGDGRGSARFEQKPQTPGVLHQAVIVGPEHSHGKYRVFGILSNKALEKHEIRELVERGAWSKYDAEVVEREMMVGP